MTNALRDRYGFWFWLRWIFCFAASFIVSAAIWTTAMRLCFGRIEGAELTTTWLVSVFGSWFLLVIPFMRKKEEIWKRLNDDQAKAVDAWFLGMGLYIGWLIVSSFFWSFLLRSQIHTTTALGLDRHWAKAVIGSWLVALIPFLIFMYRQADKIFKNALERQTATPRYRSIFVEPSKRLLPSSLADKLKNKKPVLRGGHVVEVLLKDGRRVPHVFILNSREILGVYDRMDLGFDVEEVLDLEPTALDRLPAYEEPKWLRLDGAL